MLKTNLCILTLTIILLAGCGVPSPTPISTLATALPTVKLADTPTTVSPAEQSAAPTPSPLPPEPTNTSPSPSPTSVELDNEANADVTFVKAAQTNDQTWTFYVTVSHPDTGWDDYADGWDVLLPDGPVIKPNPEAPFTRLLLHPHENEQPFTRSQSNIKIPADATIVIVRAHDLVAGWGGAEVIVDLSQTKGEGFEVVR